MITVQIHYKGKDDFTTIISKHSTFETFVKELFKARIYLSLTDDGSPAMAINTENILYVIEVLK